MKRGSRHRLIGILLLLAASGMASTASAQDLPQTRIWLAAIEAGVPSSPVAISEAQGYNNQPMFSEDGKTVFYTAEQGDGQTDIAAYVIATGQRSIVARSAESEYSPTPIPGQAAVSVIRVESDQRQRLWRIDLASKAFSLLLPKVEPVGYHTWFSHDRVAMFILGDSFTLHGATIGDQPSKMLFDNIGRTLRGNPRNGLILFVDKNTEPWSIATFDAKTGEVRAVMALFPGVEDFEADPEGRFWMGSGSKLYRSDPANRRWMLAADLREYGIDDITRLAISPNGQLLAIVGSPRAPDSGKIAALKRRARSSAG